ncbi:hypothetical protein FEM48_Zijuj02G0209300 [Ziziphus jujuba var. spinosa]|uniref:Uncharacterized protein n=1 Tax=Ziziphus jujuba var. spinosa TaxID=714518 RepID=A0A978VXW9_ZIZJJ|nr:hypothetical protein FEM48_Zijuj02G0209300 [Ziziphus jujuba var. spinosa]
MGVSTKEEWDRASKNRERANQIRALRPWASSEAELASAMNDVGRPVVSRNRSILQWGPVPWTSNKAAVIINQGGYVALMTNYPHGTEESRRHTNKTVTYKMDDFPNTWSVSRDVCHRFVVKHNGDYVKSNGSGATKTSQQLKQGGRNGDEGFLGVHIVVGLDPDDGLERMHELARYVIHNVISCSLIVVCEVDVAGPIVVRSKRSGPNRSLPVREGPQIYKDFLDILDPRCPVVLVVLENQMECRLACIRVSVLGIELHLSIRNIEVKVAIVMAFLSHSNVSGIRLARIDKPRDFHINITEIAVAGGRVDVHQDRRIVKEREWDTWKHRSMRWMGSSSKWGGKVYRRRKWDRASKNRERANQIRALRALGMSSEAELASAMNDVGRPVVSRNRSSLQVAQFTWTSNKAAVIINQGGYVALMTNYPHGTEESRRHTNKTVTYKMDNKFFKKLGCATEWKYTSSGDIGDIKSGALY